jgi:threonine dehydrogenase-like Zn-dependent dehydrogenase
MLKHFGAARLVVADPGQFKLELATKVRADNAVLVEREYFSLHRKKTKNLESRGFEIAMDATRRSKGAQRCFDYAKK